MTKQIAKKFRSLESLAAKLRRDLKGVRARKKTPKRKGTSKVAGNDFLLLFAHNGVGKTRLSMEFKELGKRNGKRDTLYYNAFTEDLFYWDNDIAADTDRKIQFKAASNFFRGLDGMGIEDRIRPHLARHSDFNFSINYADSEIRFFRDAVIGGRSQRLEDIKISRGEENLFIWCFFLAVLELAAEAKKGDPYDWVKYVFIDDPISSLDEHNSIALAADLAALLKSAKDRMKVVISTHHGLFFNIMFNELKGKWSSSSTEQINKKSYILHRFDGAPTYVLQEIKDCPFLHHIALLAELHGAAKSGEITQYHCNSLRNILEKTAVFFGNEHFSSCFAGMPNRAVYKRLLDIRSHGKYSVFDPEPLHPNEKKLFREALMAFTQKFPFDPLQIAKASGKSSVKMK